LRAIVQILLNAIAILLVARIVPGIQYQGDWIYLLLTGVVFGLLNLIVKPLVTVLSLPFVVLSLGLFFIVINGFILYLAAWLLDGLTIDGCGAALLGGLVIALFNWVVRAFDKE
jgi:putative membrane protein